MVEVDVVNGDIMIRPCDILILKHADGFYGVDARISDRLEFTADVAEGDSVFLKGRGIEARKILYLGVGPLQDFRYEKIRKFARRSLQIAAQGSGQAGVICTPIHGPGYGLDEREAFLSLVGGFTDAINAGEAPRDMHRLEIVELGSNKARRLKALLSDLRTEKVHENTHSDRRSLRSSESGGAISAQSLASFGGQSEIKPKLFVAMPFASEHSDVWEIAIQEACQQAGILCERIDQQAYVGDIIQRIKHRVELGAGLIAVLNDSNPNVFLELGFAWGLRKPTVLVAPETLKLPFDVQGQKCILYSSIADLRKQLSSELISLKSQGIFAA